MLTTRPDEDLDRAQADGAPILRPQPWTYSTKIGAGAVILDAKRNRYHLLNASASGVWDRLKDGVSTDAIVDSLGVLDDVADRRADVEDLLAALHAAQLVRVDPATRPKAGPAHGVENAVSAMGLGARILGYCFLMLATVMLRVLSLETCFRLASWRRNRSARGSLDDVARVVDATRPPLFTFGARVSCLERSLAAILWCRVVGIESQWCIGVRDAPFAAHAWVEMDGVVVDRGDVAGHRTLVKV